MLKQEDTDQGVSEKIKAEGAPRRIQGTVRAKVFPVIVICSACNLQQRNPNPRCYIIHVTRRGT
jgi:hypothetical protein